MAKWSLHLGLNKVDRKHYGTEAALSGCVNDATSMESIARSRGYVTTLLLNERATSQAVLGWLSNMARSAKSGDTLLVSYAGHGAQVADTNNPPEPDGLDETWCLYDRMLVDDELGQAWSRFAAGVRILFVSDSCHSATVARPMLLASKSLDGRTRDLINLPLIGESFGRDKIVGYRVLADEIALAAEERNRDLYASIQRSTVGTEDVVIVATVLTLAACQDNQLAADGNAHGLFTNALLDVWSGGAFRGGHPQFFAGIKAKMQNARQKPHYRIDGSANASFEAETPFGSTKETRQPQPQQEDFMSDTTSIDERLAILTGSRSRIIDVGNGLGMCRMILDVPNDAITGRPDQEVYDFLQQNAAPTLMKAFLTANSVKLTTRSVEGSIECRADTKGNAGCSGSISIRF
jgi:hypothetical protein